jgi:glycosyltransferase involved in cell wall biosynthesis
MPGRDNILVSVVAPVFNVEKFLPRAIKSMQGQSHGNFELILVIDGSPDGSESVARYYASEDPRIKVIVQKNKGVSEARNMGLSACKGDYVCLIDPDDYVEPYYVSYMLDMAVDNQADISLTTRMFGSFKSNKQTIGDNIVVWSPEEAAEAILYYHIPIGCYCKLFKRDFLMENEIKFLKNFFVGEGFNFNVTAFQHANKIVAGKRKTYFYYRENSTSAMTKFSAEKCKNGLSAIENIRENLTLKTKRLYRAVDFATYHTNLDFLQWMHNAEVVQKHPELYNDCRAVVRRMAFRAVFAPVGLREKVRCILMGIAPTLVASAGSYIRKKKSAS